MFYADFLVMEPMLNIIELIFKTNFNLLVGQFRHYSLQRCRNEVRRRGKWSIRNDVGYQRIVFCKTSSLNLNTCLPIRKGKYITHYNGVIYISIETKYYIFLNCSVENHQPLITKVWTQVSLCISKLLTYIQYLLYVAMSSIIRTSKRKPWGRRYCICWGSVMHLTETIRRSTLFYWLLKGIASAQSAEQKEDKKIWQTDLEELHQRFPTLPGYTK